MYSSMMLLMTPWGYVEYHGINQRGHRFIKEYYPSGDPEFIDYKVKYFIDPPDMSYL